MINHAEAFRRDPMVAGFLATALQDLALNERDEGRDTDTGTIYTVPQATLRRAIDECETFSREAGSAVAESALDLESLGSDLYLERAGHGAGFQDRDHGAPGIGERLSAAVSPRGSLELYVGDDGQVWIMGAETC